MSAVPDLVSLLYRADWTQLTLSAVANDGTRVVLAPGRRYRVADGDGLTGCNGDRPWRLDARPIQDGHGEVHWYSGPEPPLPDLLCPAWLLISSQLELRAEARARARRFPGRRDQARRAPPAPGAGPVSGGPRGGPRRRRIGHPAPGRLAG